tara:strand:- start:284 stop:1255 length:972 start_codon:yes stop_codon:yes gene_type:complete
MATIPNMNWMGNQPSGSAYDVYQYYLGGGNAGGSSTPSSGGGGITSLPFYKQTGGGGGGQSGLGGRYGNLDLSKTKNFTKNVWSDTTASGQPIGPPGQFDWTSKDVTGYLNPTLGGYQTLEGKNINHLGLTVPSIAGMLFDKDFGKGPKPGDIEGTFTKGFESGIGKIKGGWEDEKEKWSKVIGLKKNKAKKEKQVKEHQAAVLLAAQEKAAKEKAKADAAAAVGDGRYGRGSGGQKSHDFGTGFGTHATSGGPVSNRTGRGRTDYDDGGMVNDPEYRGWKKMYEANPEIGSMHKKHPSFIKFYKKHERDKKKFGGLAGLLYG